MVDASHLKEEEYNYIKDKTLVIAELIPELDEKIDSVSEDGNKPSRKDRAFYYETCCV